MTSAAPSATSAAPNESGVRRLLRATEVDTRMLGMIAALALIWIGFQHHHLGSNRRGPVPVAAQLMEFERPDVVDRGHGDGHGARHRHAPHRPLGRIDHRLRLDDHRRGAGPYPADLSRPRQSGDLDHRRDPCLGDRRGDRRLSRLAGRLHRHSVLHRHARRPIVLARRRVVGDDRPDHRAARQPLRADGRGPAWLDRSEGELGAGGDLLRRDRVRSLRRPSAAGAVSFPSTADVGGICHRGRRLLRRPRRDRDRQRLSLARAGRRGLCGGQQYSRAGRRTLHFDRICDSGADRARHRPCR